MTETQLKQHPVILTRTGAVNQRLALRFSKLGFRTFAWPAFTIRLPEDETPAYRQQSGYRPAAAGQRRPPFAAHRHARRHKPARNRPIR